PRSATPVPIAPLGTVAVPFACVASLFFSALAPAMPSVAGAAQLAAHARTKKSRPFEETCTWLLKRSVRHALHGTCRVGRPLPPKLKGSPPARDRLKSMAAGVLGLVGETPIVDLRAIAPAGSSLLAKLEAQNPSGSVKDRAALAMVEAAERSGALRSGSGIVEATGGNTGHA